MLSITYGAVPALHASGPGERSGRMAWGVESAGAGNAVLVHHKRITYHPNTMIPQVFSSCTCCVIRCVRAPAVDILGLSQYETRERHVTC